MKKTIKINFRYFWEGFNPEDNFFTDLLKKEYKVVISDEPDYMFYSIYDEPKGGAVDLSKKGDFIKKISPPTYRFLRKAYPKLKNILKGTRTKIPEGDFKRFLYVAEHIRIDKEDIDDCVVGCDLAFSSWSEELIGHPKHFKLPMHRVTSYGLSNNGKPLITKDIDMEQIKKEKVKFCNFIYSNDIKARNDFFTLLNEYKRVDSPGRCMTNMTAISHDNPKKSRSSFDWSKEKEEFIKQYKFTIAFENKSEQGLIIEKLIDPMLVNSIPIYIGHESVKDEFNTKSFINYHDFNNMDDFIKYIIKVDTDDELYEKILREPFYLETGPDKSMDDNRILEAMKEEIVWEK